MKMKFINYSISNYQLISPGGKLMSSSEEVIRTHQYYSRVNISTDGFSTAYRVEIYS